MYQLAAIIVSTSHAVRILLIKRRLKNGSKKSMAIPLDAGSKERSV